MISLDWNRLLPVIVSILIIIAIAVLRQYSRTLSAIIAVMPLNIPLGMWIIYAGAEDGQQAITEFNQALLINIIPTLFFMLVAWQLTRAGWGLWPTIGAGYAVWGAGLLLLVWLRGLLGW